MPANLKLKSMHLLRTRLPTGRQRLTRILGLVLVLLGGLPGTSGCLPQRPERTPVIPTRVFSPSLVPTYSTPLNGAISPLLVGNNVWMFPNERVWAVTAEAGLGLIRIGGIAFDKALPSRSMLSDWVEKIKSMGAEPMIQVSRYDSPEAAAELVRYFNLDTGNTVHYWNIGNEPFCNNATPENAAVVAGYVRPIAESMKAVDATIKIFAPDECDFVEPYYAALLSADDGPADITGKVPGQAYYYIDGVSWHHYVGFPPENAGIDELTSLGANAFLVRSQQVRQLVDQANAARGRTGEDALQWGIGEFNSNEGTRVCSFENGQMFAQVYGSLMEYGGTYAATWAMFENGGRCVGTDFSFVDADMQPRSTYYHMQMIARYFSGNYLPGVSSVESVRAFGALDAAQNRLAVMLMNISTSDPQECELSLEVADPGQGEGCRIHMPAGLGLVLEQTVGPQTTLVLLFDLQGKLSQVIRYSKGDNTPTFVVQP